MIVWSLFIIDLMGLFFYTKIGSIISIGDLPTTNIIEPVFKRFGHQIHLMVQKEAKRCGIEFMGGPQGQVVRFLDSREENQDLVLIKDIEQELNITKSVASNLVKRMVQNGLVELEASPVDKRAKFVRLTDKSRSQMQ